MPKFPKNTSEFRMKGFSGFHSSPLRDEAKPTIKNPTPSTDYQTGQVSDYEYEKQQDSAYQALIAKNVQTSGDDKTVQNIDVKTDDIKKGDKKSKLKVAPEIWASLIGATVPAVMSKILEEDEPLPVPDYESSALGFSQMEIGTGAGLINPLVKKKKSPTRNYKKGYYGA
jgi:CRISPR/Cas system-associated protein Csx1